MSSGVFLFFVSDIYSFLFNRKASLVLLDLAFFLYRRVDEIVLKYLLGRSPNNLRKKCLERPPRLNF